ncbi:MAG: hypothetical protein O3B72_04450 [Proteobacteria bacterium]|jgi:tetratricopeptide (TPR) repeat protein|nr:hypothetical protein [Pseudomonadota bacterium]
MKLLINLLAVVFLCQINTVYAADIAALQSRWAEANYEITGDDQAAAFESLIADVNAAVAAEPGNPDLLIWKAIIESTYAGKTSGLSALSLVKSARSALEDAMGIDPMALNGSAYTSLGALYYQVPPWPIAFGSSKKARQYLEKALEINPDGIDSNYFYGAFMVEEQEYDAAKRALEKALQAPDRPDRPIADRGRREEIRSLLNRIADKV